MKIVLVCIAFVVLTAVGFYFQDFFMRSCLNLLELKKNRISIRSSTMSAQFSNAFTFAVSIGLLPVYYGIIRKFTKRPKFSEALLIFSVMIGSGLFAIFFRSVVLNMMFYDFEKITIPGVNEAFPIQRVGFSQALFFGNFFGALLCFALFKWGFPNKVLQTKENVEV